MKEILTKNLIRLFVYGTLRKGQRLEFYMQGGDFKGYFITQGQLMKSANGSVYIDKKYKNVFTIGELYYVNFYCLQRINHLELISGEFPQGYELNLTRIWPLGESKHLDFDEKKSILAFYFRRKNNPVKILTGDYSTDFDTIEEIGKFLHQNQNKAIKPDDIINYMNQRMSIWEYEG